MRINQVIKLRNTFGESLKSLQAYRGMFGPLKKDGSRAIRVASKILRDAADNLIDSITDLVKGFVYLAVHFPIVKKHARALKEAFPHAYLIFEAIWTAHKENPPTKYQPRIIPIIQITPPAEG